MGKLVVKCGFCYNELLRHKTKTDTYFCDISCKAKWQILQREKLGYDKDWLIDQYFNLNKNCNQIAKEIKKDPKRVWQWMKDYGLEVNKRGSNYTKNLCLDGSVWIGRKHKDSTKSKIRETRIKDGNVPYLNKEGNHWLKGVTDKGHPSYKGGLTPEIQSFYSSTEWSEAVKKVWKRDNAICQNCGKNHNTEINRGNFHIHHIVSFQVRELRSVLSNLVLLCKECHRWVHSNKNVTNKFIIK